MLMQGGVTVVALALAGYGVLLGGLFVAQRGLLYHPTQEAPALPRALQPELREVESETADGLRLRHWYHPPNEMGAPVLVVFHGNAGDRADRLDKYAAFPEAGYGLFLADYRGYAGNPGRPSEAGLIADGRSVLDWLEAHGVPGGRHVLYGESLGTGVAVALAAERPVGAVVLESPFTALADVAQAHYWYVPAKWMMLDRFDSAARIADLQAPLMVLHGEADDTVPVRFGRRLFEMAPEPKEALFLPGAGHVDLFGHGADAAAVDFIRRRLPTAAAAAG